VKRRDVEAPGFLERPPGWWQQRRPYLNARGFQLRAYAGMILAGMGELSADELARLERIAAGDEQDPPLSPDAARAILAQR
jgi:hypothetical protein